MPPGTSATRCAPGSGTTTARSSSTAVGSASSPATYRSKVRGSTPSKRPGSTANAASSKPTACSPSMNWPIVSPTPTTVPMSPISSCPKRSPDHALGILATRECSVEELAALLELRAPTVSHHLARLKDLGLVAMRADGNTHLYHLECDALRTLSKDVL